jgi:hypothetical protein
MTIVEDRVNIISKKSGKNSVHNLWLWQNALRRPSHTSVEEMVL